MGPTALVTTTEAVGYASGAMPVTARPSSPDAAPPLPADDPSIFEMDLRGLRRRWAARAALPAISAETMTGADRRAQALGYPETRLMEHAGTAVGAAVRALAHHRGESRCPLLAEAIPLIGDCTIRYRGTLGGSLAHADPVAELPTVMLALDAELVLRGPNGARTVPAADFFVTYLTTALEPDEP